MSSVVIAGNTSGSITISAPDVSGSNTLTLPVATDTLVGKATTDTLTNKTLVAPVLGAATATSIAVSGASTFTGTGKFATTIGVGNATPSASGSGITFPATQSASSDVNTLDDYEEGTWTPSDGSGAGRVFSNIGSSYVKIGRQVTVNCYIIVAATANTSSFTVAGLPFSSAASTQTVGTFNSSSGNSGTSIIGATSATVTVGTLTTYNINLTNSQISNAGVAFTITYFV